MDGLVDIAADPAGDGAVAFQQESRMKLHHVLRGRNNNDLAIPAQAVDELRNGPAIRSRTEDSVTKCSSSVTVLMEGWTMPGQREFPQCGKMTAELKADLSQFPSAHIE